MPTLTIPDVPESVVLQLEALAKEQGCTVEGAARLCLEEGLPKMADKGPMTREEVERFLEEVRISRESLRTPPLTEEFLREAKNWGRP